MIIMATPSAHSPAPALAPAPTGALFSVQSSKKHQNLACRHPETTEGKKQHTSRLQNLILRNYGSLKVTKDKLLDTTKRQKQQQQQQQEQKRKKSGRAAAAAAAEERSNKANNDKRAKTTTSTQNQAPHNP